ncbi:MAG: CRTAC1 family protein [Chloroflexi bacterium]|nr:CRTAC1 family protein [Chloroflexota bacterium]
MWGCSGPRPRARARPGVEPPSVSATSHPQAVRAKTSYLFRDVAAAAGVRYRWVIAGKRPLNILQTIGNGCAFLDYDNDGNLDVLVVGPKLALFHGDGHGHFSDVTHQTGLDKLTGHFLGCAVGDYDNDGFDDIYLSAYRGGVLLHNDGGHGFTDVTARSGIPPQAWGTSCSFADVDGDGRLDLYVAGYVAFGPGVKPQLCDYGGRMSACGPRFYLPQQGRLYHNEGNGRFRDVTKQWGAQRVQGKTLGVAFADYDGSGKQSLALANDEMPGDLLRSTARGFVDQGSRSGTIYDNAGNVHGGMGLDWGDYDNDGKLDLAVATFQDEAKCVYHDDGAGLFTERSADLGIADPARPLVAFGVKWLDYDNDGWLDLIFSNGHVQDNISAIDHTATYRQPLRLFHNEQAKSFEDVSRTAGPAFQQPIVGRGLAVGDFDNDGRIDVLVVDSEGAPLLLHNECRSAAHWVSFRLIGTRSNRDGIGAIVELDAGGRRLYRRCATDGSYLSASDRRVHFGLGCAATASAHIRWPSGIVTVLRSVPVDRVVTVREGR